MLTRLQLTATWCYVLLLSLLWITPTLLASEFSQLIEGTSNNPTELNNDHAHHLPQQYATDSQGNHLTLPTEDRAALKYNADDIFIKPSLQQYIDDNKAVASSSRQASTPVADDPNCRWLHSRIKHLQKKQKQVQNSRFSHYQDEIDIRKDEWACLKCATSGPNDVDRGECQYKR